MSVIESTYSEVTEGVREAILQLNCIIPLFDLDHEFSTDNWKLK